MKLNRVGLAIVLTFGLSAIGLTTHAHAIEWSKIQENDLLVLQKDIRVSGPFGTNVHIFKKGTVVTVNSKGKSERSESGWNLPLFENFHLWVSAPEGNGSYSFRIANFSWFVDPDFRDVELVQNTSEKAASNRQKFLPVKSAGESSDNGIKSEASEAR